ncbi:unnamed protein product [Meloidogyne enterolobii]|uniref:Uncharacterized protein n=1 Tax=Meloidogyne enterolobii TaxID=390850 RepID=A0ACB1AED9_MELEN
MKQMMIVGSDPMIEMKNCLVQVWANEIMIEEIRRCADGSQSFKFQLEDEHNTNQILTQKPRFVPFLSFNDFSHIQIQSSLQLFFVEKMRHWNKTIEGNNGNNQLQNIDNETNERISRTTKFNSKECNFPPEFWCINEKITLECFNKELCNQQNLINYGRPLNFKIIFNSKFEESRNYLIKYILNNLLNKNTLKYKLNFGKMFVELEPSFLTNQELEECGFSEWCAQRILEICIAGSVADINQKNNLLLCLNTRYEQINLNWINECLFTSEVERQSIINCAQNSQIWQTYNSKLRIQQTQPFLGPEPIKNNLWILINNYSLSTIQNYIYILEQMVCLWYNGPGHNRDNCGRCEYEPSRCKIN